MHRPLFLVPGLFWILALLLVVSTLATACESSDGREKTRWFKDSLLEEIRNDSIEEEIEKIKWRSRKNPFPSGSDSTEAFGPDTLVSR